MASILAKAAFGSALTAPTHPGQHVRTSRAFTTTSTAPSPSGLPLIGQAFAAYAGFWAAMTADS